MALSGLDEFAIAPTERPRARTVAFLSGLTHPRICGGKLLLPKVSEGDEKVAYFLFSFYGGKGEKERRKKSEQVRAEKRKRNSKEEREEERARRVLFF